MASTESEVNDGEKDIEQLVDIVRNGIVEPKLALKPRTDFDFLSKFLRIKKYNPPNAVSAVRKYYSTIFCYLPKFENLQVSQISPVYDHAVFQLLKRPLNNIRIGYVSIQNWKPDVISLEEVALASAFYYEELLTQKEFQLHGGCLIIDLSGLSFKHVTNMGYKALKFFTKMISEIYPIRVAGLHFLHTPLLFWPIYKIVENFTPQKIRSRVKFHSDVSALAESLSCEVLPKRLGGNLEEDESWDDSLVSRLITANPLHRDYWKVD